MKKAQSKRLTINRSALLKPTTLAKVKDNSEFQLSKRTKSKYVMQRKKKGIATFTSKQSGRTFDRKAVLPCYVPV